MNRRLKTVPLREFFGESSDTRRFMRRAAIGLAMVELSVIAIVLWRILG